MKRFGAVLCALVCLSFGLQALGLDILSIRNLSEAGGEFGGALRLCALLLGLSLWFGPSVAATLRR